MPLIKKYHLLSIVSIFLFTIAIIGGYLTLFQGATETPKEFFYFSLFAIAGSAIQIYLYQKDKQKTEKQKHAL